MLEISLQRNAQDLPRESSEEIVMHTVCQLMAFLVPTRPVICKRCGKYTTLVSRSFLLRLIRPGVAALCGTFACHITTGNIGRAAAAKVPRDAVHAVERCLKRDLGLNVRHQRQGSDWT